MSWEPSGVTTSSSSSDHTDKDTNENDHNSHHHYHSKQQPYQGTSYFWFTTLPSAMDLLLFGAIYPLLVSVFDGFFVDIDGELIYEWTHYYRAFAIAITFGWLIVLLRIGIGLGMVLSKLPASTYYMTTTYYMIQPVPVVGSCLQFVYSKVWLTCKARFSHPPKAFGCWRCVTSVVTLSSTLFLIWTIGSLVVHFGDFEPDQPHHDPTMCDPLDMTECILPFPSFYHLKKDTSTVTGYRVDLKPESFPMLKGRVPISTDFLKNLDGFSTMGPILFYIEGMQESHENYLQLLQVDPSWSQRTGMTRLRGHQEIALSVSPFSATLLVDVASKELVPHSAEIDYLDPERPLVLVFPAQPLKHNSHYALAVMNATDLFGNRLAPSPGLLNILDGDGPDGPSTRKHLFKNVLMASLEAATHKVANQEDVPGDGWGGPYGSYVRNHDPPALQLLFDFHTASKESQIGAVRRVRDLTLQHVGAQKWSNNWGNHVRLVRQVDGHCRDSSYPLARTIHAELDVPWFLTGFGPGNRAATLDLSSGAANTIGKAKFVVHVPCSLKQVVIQDPKMNVTAQNLRSVVEFGHGLFGNRDEAASRFLIQMANRNGYILTAMDWRGMSQFDFPIVARTMLTDPSLFEAIRDSLIQGYANKFALQHFIQNGMLEMPWLQFPKRGSGPQTIPHDAGTPSMFYGISQGGILGAGYVSLSGPTKLIERGALGVPGTPFSLVLSRSLQFVGYDVPLLLTFYNNRHVRIFLSLAQMCWDSVEAAGVLGQPLDEPIPRVLLQAGLGDPIVPTLAAERLARAFGASILPNAPRQPIFGIPVENPSGNMTAALTEILYQKEYDSLPIDDELIAPNNDVHNCVRLESVLQYQIEEFFNSGTIMDPCEGANGTACRRRDANCFDRH